MVSLETADKALKEVYLGIVADQLNVGVNPFLAKVKTTDADVWGKEIVKLVPYGVNGGVGAGTETGELPAPAGNNYDRFRLELKNLYGTIEISDKAVRASQSGVGAFVNLLNAEMDGLLKASKFNLGRMLYGDGSGVLTHCAAGAISGGELGVKSVKSLMEGMKIDVCDGDTDRPYEGMSGVRILSVDRAAKKIKLDCSRTDILAENDYLTVQGSRGNEITGLGALFGMGDLYGLKRAGRAWMNPYRRAGETVTCATLQSGLDYIEEVAGSGADIILCSYDVRRKYIAHVQSMKIGVDYTEVAGGFRTVTYNGIPVVADRFVEDGTLYMLNTADFKLHQLCDWRWLEGDGGRVIKQNPGTATYGATLVKYADMICDKPIGQAMFTDLRA